MMKKIAIFVSLVAMVLLVPIVGNQALNDTAQKKYAKWEWSDASLEAVFTHISAISGVDVVMDPDLEGRVTLKLRDKTWQEVFKIVCKTQDLHYDIEDEYIYVMTEKAFITKQVEKSQSERNLESVEELEKIIVKLKNTTATEMQAPVQGLLSDRGKVTIVEHTNSLIIDELGKNVDKIVMMIDSLDKELIQVSISTKIVEVSSDNKQEMGIQWSFFDQSTGAAVSHLPGATGVSGALEQITYGILDQKGFSFTLDFLLGESESEVVAEPQITTTVNKEAHIFMGSRVPISSLDYAGNQTITMIDAGTELTVTPRITSDGRVKMELNPIKKSYSLNSNGDPVIHEQGAETEVVVRDGETVVIAGLSSDDKQHSEGGIPFLKDIPILGYLFKTEKNSNEKKDLVIFVTPHIVKTTALDVLLHDDENSSSMSSSSNAFEVE